jgi:translation initiation factor 1
MCDRCGQLESDCRCPPEVIPKTGKPSDRKTVKLSVEKRKKGKLVTVIRGLSIGSADLAALLSQLKSQCGAGGTLEGETLELQGNHLDRLRKILGDAGHKVIG